MSHCLEIQVARCPPETAGLLWQEEPRPLLGPLPESGAEAALQPALPTSDGAGAAPRPVPCGGAEAAPQPALLAPQPSLPREVPRSLLSLLSPPLGPLSLWRCRGRPSGRSPPVRRSRGRPSARSPCGGAVQVSSRPHTPRRCGSEPALVGPAPGEASAAAGSISAPPARREGGEGGCCHSCPAALALSSCFLAAALVACREQNQGPLRASRSRQLGKGSFGFSRCQRLLFLSVALMGRFCSSLLPSSPRAPCKAQVDDVAGEFVWSFRREGQSCLGRWVVLPLQPRWCSSIKNNNNNNGFFF